jgi:hypothetical protein
MFSIRTEYGSQGQTERAVALQEKEEDTYRVQAEPILRTAQHMVQFFFKSSEICNYLRVYAPSVETRLHWL